jgi:hypothetical protein
LNRFVIVLPMFLGRFKMKSPRLYPSLMAHRFVKTSGSGLKVEAEEQEFSPTDRSSKKPE